MHLIWFKNLDSNIPKQKWYFEGNDNSNVDNKFTICTAKLDDISLQWGNI